MTRLLRFLSIAHHRALLGFVLAALGMQAFVPAGLMLAPASGDGAQIILCPQTHPLARAAAAQISADLAAMHLAMGHAPAPDPAPDDNPGPAQSAAANAQSCAFAGAGALAGLPPDQPVARAPLTSGTTALAQPLRPLQIAPAAHVRPPLRAPPQPI